MKADFTSIKEINEIKARRNHHAFMTYLLGRKIRRLDAQRAAQKRKIQNNA